MLLLLLALIASPSPSPAAVRARSHTAVGRIVRVDEAARRVEVAEKPEARPMVFDVAADARIVRAGRVATLADAKPGTSVVVTCRDRRDGSHEAVELRLRPPAP